MSSRDYPRLLVEEFGRQLLETGDLDPVYIALRRVEWPEEQMRRWLLAYWLCYHAGAASWLSEQKGVLFWAWLMAAARNEDPAPVGKHMVVNTEKWPRAPERRHWRGQQAVKSVEFLMERYQLPEHMVDYIIGNEDADHTCQAVRQRTEEHWGFGAWVSFKVADMLERVLDVPVRFSYDDVMYEEPRRGALMIWREKAGVPVDARIKDEDAAIRQVISHLLDHFKDEEAPPLGGSERQFGLQEAETLACKYKGHLNGHYPVGNDIIDIRRGLEPWARVSEAAAEMLHWFPAVPQALPEAQAGTRG